MNIGDHIVQSFKFDFTTLGAPPGCSTRINVFRRVHLDASEGLFVQVLRHCLKAGLVSLDNVALDSTRMKANPSKHKAMSHERMLKAEAQLEAEMAALLRKAELIDAQEDERYGKDKRGDELPPELQRRQERLKVLRKARVKLEAEVLQAIYGVRSERMLVDQLVYNLLFHWFVGLNPDDPLWHPTTFTPTSAVDRSWRSHWNRERLLNEVLMACFLELLMASPEVKPLLSSKHVSFDGTLLRAWDSHNSLERIDGTDDDPPPPSGGKRKRALSQLPGPLPHGQPAWPGGG